VARKIYAAIAGGHFPEGSLLPNELALCETIGVSRTALREAIKGLSSKGMLETRRRRGTQVTDRSQWTIADAEVIKWSRAGGDKHVGEQLWQCITHIMPVLVASVANSPKRSELAYAAQRDDSIQSMAMLFLDIARLSNNRFLASLVSIGMSNLAAYDKDFLAARCGEIDITALNTIRDLIVVGDAEQADRAMQVIFAPGSHISSNVISTIGT
jgi:DNA-binding FadR family transcriptional regulator